MLRQNTDEQEERNVRPQRHHVPLTDVGEAQHPENERDADRAERQDAAEEEAIHREPNLIQRERDKHDSERRLGRAARPRQRAPLEPAFR